MKQFKEKLIVGIDHGYGNIKTANHCFKTGVMGFDAEPLFTKEMAEDLMSPDLRHEARNIEQYVSDYRFLQREEIHTVKDLSDSINNTRQKIADLELERSKADNTRRRAHSPEKVQAAKDERKAITEKIRPLREK